MFLNHDAAFDTFAPALSVTTPAHTLTVTASALIETEAGWRRAGDLTAADSIATLDGGFTRVRHVEPGPDAGLIHVPGGTLSTCSDVTLPASAHVALDLPAHLSDAPLVSVPLQALVGWRGIRRIPQRGAGCVTLSLADEEMVYAQTGLLLHTDTADGFFQRKSYGEARALITLMDGVMPAPDLAVAA